MTLVLRGNFRKAVVVKERIIKIIKYLIAGFGISFTVIYYKNFEWSMSTADKCMILSDGFFFTGIILAGVGGLTAMSNEGMFDIMFYGVKSFFNVITRRNDGQRDGRSYYDYRMERQEKKKSFFEMLIAGIIYIIAAGVFTMLFEHYYVNPGL